MCALVCQSWWQASLPSEPFHYSCGFKREAFYIDVSIDKAISTVSVSEASQKYRIKLSTSLLKMILICNRVTGYKNPVC